MNSFVIVVLQIFFKCAINFKDIVWYFVQTFFLYRSVYSFNMRIVIRFSDSRISMTLLYPGSEPVGKLWSMIRLQHGEMKLRMSLRFFYKTCSNLCTHFLICFCIHPSRIYIYQHKNIQPPFLVYHPVDGINLHQIT